MMKSEPEMINLLRDLRDIFENRITHYSAKLNGERRRNRKPPRAEWLWDGDERKQFEDPHPGSFAVMDPEPEPEKPPKPEGEEAKEPAVKKAEETTEETSDPPPKPGTVNMPPQPEKTKKRKCILLLGYCGTGYMGMQINPGAVTIEAEVERAVYRAGLMIRENYGFPQKVHWMRAARTDKGVHAARQVISLKLLTPEGNEENMCQDINRHLPESIRCHKVVRVSKQFHAKNACTKRRYQYIMPTYLLEDAERMNRLFEEEIDNYIVTKKDQDGEPKDENKEDTGAGGTDDLGPWGKCSKTDTESSNAEDDKDEDDWKRKPVIIPPEVLQAVSEKVKGFRLSQEKLKMLRKLLNKYEGTRNYHNFTSRKDVDDMSCNRFVMSFKCSQPYLEGDVEWVCLSVLGQSFLLNQIRKMVALCVQIVRGEATMKAMEEALFSREKVYLAIAPGEGLYLDNLYFDKYNDGIEKAENGKERLRLEFESGELAEQIEAFKKAKIISHIVKQEMEEQPFLKWVNYLRVYPTKFD
eukprot:CAMPEP_0117755932 /NCGR_PEP_ID=MMETSP0947-20121206/13752_1 /TAXON_ID=44440 /ORGANISM="Chattonella subsalsa, Strain CCMP2191" /LENGTH=524 /DNA_ID=CAMNT_0005575373 /DNA_START=202 /DNA_END=1776 /DNA_ORIENTATION=-